MHLAAISQVPENAPLGRLREGGGKERTGERREAQKFATYIERSGNSRDLSRRLLLNLKVKVKAMQSPIGARSNEPRLQRTRGSIFWLPPDSRGPYLPSKAASHPQPTREKKGTRDPL